MHIIIGYSKGEAFVVAHTGSKNRAQRWIEDYPNGENDEFDYVEVQVSHSL
ncbi:hypothetical protein SEA_CHICKENKING_29 [Microbacterium phage ChickenKing]|nr:hypothetical protein SEA_CHICKENKING_29 [Microbacterium phage ChickenKing]